MSLATDVMVQALDQKPGDRIQCKRCSGNERLMTGPKSTVTWSTIKPTKPTQPPSRHSQAKKKSPDSIFEIFSSAKPPQAHVLCRSDVGDYTVRGFTSDPSRSHSGLVAVNEAARLYNSYGRISQVFDEHCLVTFKRFLHGAHSQLSHALGCASV